MVEVDEVLSGVDGEVAPSGALGGLLLEALINDTTLAIGVVDSSGTVRLMSPGLLEAAGVDYTPLAAQDVSAHYDVRCADGSRQLLPEEEPLNRARAGESFRDELVSLRKPDGASVVLRCSGAPLRSGDAGPAGGIVLFDDVTAEWFATREQEVLRERLLETFNHELRTPLTSMVGHAEVLDELVQDLPAGLPEQVQRSLSAIVQAGERLRDLADTVSTLADLERASHVERVDTDLGALLEQVVRGRRAEGSDPSVVLSAPASLWARVDPTRVQAAIECLVENAVAHAPEGTAVEVTLGEQDHEVQVVVADHGPGIPARQRDRLVRPFERGDVELTSPSGRGLGLALARTVAHAHHGSLQLEDNPPHGLRATMRLESGR